MSNTTTQSKEEKKLLEEFGRNLRLKRAGKKISQERLALIAGIHRNYVGMLERGEQNPTLMTLIKLSKSLEMDITELLPPEKLMLAIPVNESARKYKRTNRRYKSTI